MAISYTRDYYVQKKTKTAPDVEIIIVNIIYYYDLRKYLVLAS